MPRLFTALEIPSDIAAELALLRGGVSGARWIEPESYHITLRFIGDVDRSAAVDIAETLSEIRTSTLRVEFEGLSWFGADKPRALIARVRSSAALSELQADHERLLRRLGHAPETRKYSPHVTLARLRGVSPLAVADYLGHRAFLSQRVFEAQRFVLYSSRESTGGGPYVVEAAYPLEAP